MTKRKKIAESIASIPAEDLVVLQSALKALKRPALEATVRGRFVYLTYDEEPLCRLGYRGNTQEWDFAIYKYSTGSYSANEAFMPSVGTVKECVNTALHAYNLA